MKDVWNKMDGLAIGLMLRGKRKFREIVEREDGDTNFISVAIILVIVLAIAGVFVKFKKEATDVLEKAIVDFQTYTN